MQRIMFPVIILLAAGCASQQGKLAWRVKDIALARTPAVELQDPSQRVVATLPTRTIQEMMLAHLRISAVANVQAELFIVDGDDPNAFAGRSKGQRIIGVNVGMVKLIGGEADEYAALLGHEAAHWAKGHVDAGETRTTTLNAIGTLVGVGLGAAGVPAGGLISGIGVDLIDASFSRDQEREADAQSVEYMLAAKYDPQAAIRLQEKMLKNTSGLRLPFLSSHPSSEERIDNLRALVEAKTSQR
jgi:predicted Zn-dependent protease